MKKLLFLLFMVALLGMAAQAMAESSLTVAQDYPPRMMNPHGDDSDAGLSYFSNLASPKTKRIMSTSNFFSIITVSSELEALLLEAKLVRQKKAVQKLFLSQIQKYLK